MDISNVTLRRAYEILGITEYPEDLDIFALNHYVGEFDPSDTENIRNLQQSENMFGDYYDLVINAAKELKNDPVSLYWAKVVSEYIYKSRCEKARAVPIPESDGSLLKDMLPLLVMIPSMLKMRELLIGRGFDDERIGEYMEIFQRCIAATERRIGRPALDRHYFKWTMLYLKGMIFSVGGFRFEIRKLTKSVIFLQNIKTKELMPVMKEGTFHRSGAVLGSAGFEDETGSFQADFEEKHDRFIGHPVQNAWVVPKRMEFLKNEWEIFVAPGDCVLAIHIPKGTDISCQAFDNALVQALEFISKYYPEYDPVCLHCHSWLLDPQLANIVGKEARITRFGDMFVRYPVKSAGKEVFSFVFPPQITDLNALPENTRLERGLKALYLDGGYVYAFGGIVRFENN